MRVLALLLLILLAAPAQASQCLKLPLEEVARSSRVIFLATLTASATSDGLMGTEGFYTIH